MFMDFFNFVKNAWGSFSNSVIDFLPHSPIVYIESDSSVKEALSYVNWFIPIYQMIALTEAWLLAIAIYYVVQVVLRWVKIIE